MPGVGARGSANSENAHPLIHIISMIVQKVINRLTDL